MRADSTSSIVSGFFPMPPVEQCPFRGRHRHRRQLLAGRAVLVHMARRRQRISHRGQNAALRRRTGEAVDIAQIETAIGKHPQLEETGGDLQTRVQRNRNQSPTGATGWLGISRNFKSFSSANGTGICSLVPPSHLIVVTPTRPLCTLASTSSRGCGAPLLPCGAGVSRSATRSLPQDPGGEWITILTFIPQAPAPFCLDRCTPGGLLHVGHPE